MYLKCCEKCVDFSKIDDLAITSSKCRKSCFIENKDCTNHTITLNQFQQVSYIHEGKKKKLKLVDNMLTTSQLVELLKNSKNLFCTDLTFNRPQKHMIIFLQFLQNGISFHPVWYWVARYKIPMYYLNLTSGDKSVGVQPRQVKVEREKQLSRDILLKRYS